MFSFIKAIGPVCNRTATCKVNLDLLFVKYSTPSVTLGKTKKVKTGPTLEKKTLPVETDTQKLVKYVCGSNIYKEGSDVELKPDSEYPEWLWDLHIGKPKTLSELDPNTIKYWKKVRHEGMKRNNKLKSMKKF